MEYKVIYSRRRTAAIQILPDGSVVVCAPYGVPRWQLDEFVCQRAGWIAQHRSELLKKAAQREDFRLLPGSTVLFLGRMVPVFLSAGIRTAQVTPEGILLPDLTEQEKRENLAKAFSAAAHEYLPGRLEALSRRTGLRSEGLTITAARTRWGSCSGRNTLALSWRLMHLSPPTIDAVILHELCHTRHHNHAAGFYRLLESVCPDYRQADAELKAVQQTISRTLGVWP